VTTHASTRFDRELIACGPRGAGCITSVYPHAVVVETDAGALVTLAPRDRPLVPFGVGLDPRAVEASVGRHVQFGPRRIAVGGVSIRLEGDGVSLGLPIGPPALGEVLATQLTRLTLPPRTCALLAGGGDDRVLERAATILTALVRALVAPAPTPGGIARRVAALVGLGPGATPTGDDLLTGIAAALGRLGERAPPAGRREYLEALAAVAPDATTPVGRAMLAHAASGHFVEPLRDLAAALGRPGPELDGAIARLAAVGAQSGADLTAGLVALGRAAAG
jgi:hypothetical protein